MITAAVLWIKNNLLLAKIGAAILILLALWLSYEHLKGEFIQQGRDEITAARNKQDKVNNLAAEAEQSRRAKVALDKTKELEAKVESVEAKAQQENKDHETALQKANARASAGNSGMQCPGRRTASQDSGQPAREDSPATGSVGNQGGTDLLPNAAVTIQSVASDSARLVRDRNELIVLYNAARATCNTP